MPSDIAAPNVSRRGLRIAAVLAAIVIVGVVAVGLTKRASGDAQLRNWTDAQAVPTVAVVTPGSADQAAKLDLPGRFEAYSRASLFARVSGYLKSWKVDIGSPVMAGELLAEIETPDLDQQILQAKADLVSAQANASLAGSTTKRWTSLLGKNYVSKQEAAEKAGDYATKQALVKAAQANVDHMQALKTFARIVAPFDGVITARQTDIGALINVGGGEGQELFVVSDTRKLRVYVSVPQNYVPDIRPGTKATISAPEHPGKVNDATVESSAQAVTATSGTTLMQLAVDNADGQLLPGGFANVSLDLPRNDAMNVPATALLFDSSGLRVATVGIDNKVSLKTVTISRDLGKVVELGSGISADDRIIDSPPDGVADGDLVRLAEPAKTKP